MGLFSDGNILLTRTAVPTISKTFLFPRLKLITKCISATGRSGVVGGEEGGVTELFSIDTKLSVLNCTLAAINSFASMRRHELLRNSAIK